MRDVQVAVVGGGPAGLSAAISAARSGARTMLLDAQPDLGGQLRYRTTRISFGIAPRTFDVRPWVMRNGLIVQARHAGVDLRPGALAWGLFEGNVLTVVEPAAAASYQLAAERIVLATGSTDLPFPFPGGTLPGVFAARALQILLHVHRILPGKRVVVLGGGPEAEEIANDVRQAGGRVVLKVAPTARGAIAAEGSGGVEAFVLRGQRLAADVVAVAVGRQPDPQLALMAECAAGYSDGFGGFVPVRDDRLVTTQPGILVAGDAAGLCDILTALAEGTLAGVSAAAGLGLTSEQAIAGARTMLDRTAPGRLDAARAVERTYVQV
jgi:sarcosine oxidase subunit alpha